MTKRLIIFFISGLVLIILGISYAGFLTSTVPTNQFDADVFSEASVRRSAAVGFLLLSGLLLCWIVLSIGCGNYASNRGRSFLGFFIFSFLISPLIGFLVAFISIGNSEINKCPDCAEFIKSEANVCKHCGKRFDLKEVENKTID